MWRFVEGDLAAVLRVPAFRLYAVSRVTAGIGQSMLQAIIAWQVYALSGSALDLGIVGLVRFVPALVAEPDQRRGGRHVRPPPHSASRAGRAGADVSSMLAAIATGHAIAATGLRPGVHGGRDVRFRGAVAPVAACPALVPRNLFSRAMTLNSTLQSLSALSGPAVGGALDRLAGHRPELRRALLPGAGVDARAVAGARAATRKRRADGDAALEAVREGLAYLSSHPVVLGAMTLDMFAVLFGGAKALLPIYAVDILHADAAGYGLLTASLDVGALLAAALMVALPTPTHIGRALLASVAAFGLATIAFGLSRWLPLSILTYARSARRIRSAWSCA